MHQELVTYNDDFNDGVETTETLYFNLNEFELSELLVKFKRFGGIAKRITDLLEVQDEEGFFEVLRALFEASYGRRVARQVEGGNTKYVFIKKREFVDELICSPAFGKFWTALMGDTAKTQGWFMGVVPKDLLVKAEKLAEKQKAGEVEVDPEVAALEAKLAELRGKKPAN